MKTRKHKTKEEMLTAIHQYQKKYYEKNREKILAAGKIKYYEKKEKNKGKPIKRWYRKCSGCGTDISYVNHSNYLQSIRLQTKCRSCNNRGENNPMYGRQSKFKGKKYNEIFGENKSLEIKKKLSGNRPAVSGENNPMYGVRGHKHPLYRENSPNWNHEKTDEERILGRSFPEYRDFVKECMERDNYECQISGRIGGELVVHHLEPYWKIKEMRLDPDNGITITKELHDHFHEIYGKKYFTKKDFIEFMSKELKKLKN